MTHPFTPDITFLLGPPVDPELRARFERAQDGSGSSRSLAERCAQLEPRLPVLVAARSGEPSILSDLVSFALEVRVQIEGAHLSHGVWKGRRVATLQLQPRHVEGPAEGVARLFEESEPALSIANLLGLVLKLEWVYSARSLAPLEEGRP